MIENAAKNKNKFIFDNIVYKEYNINVYIRIC